MSCLPYSGYNRRLNFSFPTEELGVDCKYQLIVLPRSLLYARDLAFVCELAEADTAYSEFTEISMGTTADLASVVFSGREFLCLLLLKNHRFLCHIIPLSYLSNGAPRSLRSSRPSSSVFAVVTNAMSIPLILSTLSYSISGKMSCSLRPRE